MSCVVGIDLGSTTTKAVVLDERGDVLGRGITNSRSNYDLAAAVARTEAFINARFGLIEQQVEATETAEAVAVLRRAFVMEQLLHQLRRLEQLLLEEDATHRASRNGEKLAAIDPLRARLFREPQVRLVNHGGSRQRVTTEFSPELSMRDALEVAIDQRHETLHRLRSAAAQGGQRLGDLLRLRVGHCSEVTRVASHHATRGVASFARFLRVSLCGNTTPCDRKLRASPRARQHTSWPLHLRRETYP